jgi:hypothetical protein
MDIVGDIDGELVGELAGELTEDPVANIFFICSKTVKSVVAKNYS